MEITDQDFKRVALIFLVLLLGVLVFLIVKPVILSVIGGLILAYIFYPIYKRVVKIVKYQSLAAALISILVLALLFVPLWFILPTMAEKIFDIFQLSQTFDITDSVRSIFPSGSDQLINQISITLNNAITNISSLALNSVVDFLVNFAIISLHLILVAFVFFFALKDGSKLSNFVSEISPLKKSQEKIMVKQFEDMTRSIIYGQVIVGLLQGVLAGLGFIIFGVPNAFVLTTLAVVLSVIPVIGPSLLYIPITGYLLISGDPLLAIGFLLYNLLIVSSIDNFLRAHIVSRKTQISQVIILIGMIGGIFVFGILGLIIGPLILAYFIMFLKAYRDKTLSSLFAS